MMVPFDPAGPLPTGTWALEASAGTGKTHAIAALATRYLAEGVATSRDLAVITFSRSAAGELSDRLRQRLRHALDLLRTAAAGKSPPTWDAADVALLDADPATLAARAQRLADAARELDAAAVMTIHGFCEAMLTELGIWALSDPQGDLVEDLRAERREVVRDLYLNRFANAAPAPFSLADADEIADAAMRTPDARIEPLGAPGPAGARAEFAAAARTAMAARKRALGVYDYNDQLLRLRDSVICSETARDRLRQRASVVIVDEFQDTDPIQWEILQTCFHRHSTLILIGDPKQAVYSFRGADVQTYLRARDVADVKVSLATNYRSDPPVVSALNDFYRNVSLSAGIDVTKVAAHHQHARLLIAGAPAPGMRLRCLPNADPLRAEPARRAISADLACQVAALLDGEATLCGETGERPLRADDIAVLVRSNSRGRAIADALAAAGIPVAFAGADSVFATDAARDWQTLLAALLQPGRAARRRAMFTSFIDADLRAVASASQRQLSDWSATLASWSETLAAQGIAALFARICGEGDFTERVLSAPLGERELTDHRHLAELLHAREVKGLSGGALLNWLSEAISNTFAGESTRRLETDADAVQVMTVHRAKGQQFPVVMLPQVGDLYAGDPRKAGCFTSHDPDGQRVLDVGGLGGPGRQARLARYFAEQSEDELRLLYVATTRAQSHLVVWWGRTLQNTHASPLHRVLCLPRFQQGIPAAEYPDMDIASIDWLRSAADIRLETADPQAVVTSRPTLEATPDLRLAKLGRTVDQLWRRTSYSGLTYGAHGEYEPPDEPEPDADEPAESGLKSGTRSPMADLPGGTSFGTVVHETLEALDWHTDDDAELLDRLAAEGAAALARSALRDVSATDLARALLPTVRTPLLPLTDQPLAGFPAKDRLNELDFEFSLGDASDTTLGDLADMLERWLPPGDPLAGYPQALRGGELRDAVLRGFLTGSIDCVLRTREDRFIIVDYKTNRLPVAGELFVEHYTPRAMAAEMIRSHYPLQAILYCVALHRFLQARLRGYSPAKHFGGVGYLFVRGMAGSPPVLADGQPTGVFAWHPPAGLVAELSEKLRGGGL
ncbi:MAG: UvrD-helicase domain-containing protein [Propionibacteriaceae bacterium]|jgi:exodeoxyribonuclease V beta subunit|nr:UvrD-helicase domain-containing protein [Propionibacteriaceae bacterium]